MSKLSVIQRKARSYIQQEDWGNALTELQRMLGADGDNPTLHNQIGDVYLRKNEVPKACEHFERAIDLYASVGLHNNAVALCKKVMRLRPGRQEMRYRLARLRLEQGFRNEAAVYLREYFDHVQLDPRHLDEFEMHCRESIELLEDLAPVGKILEKLEAARLYPVAFDIVRKAAQRAADAGDDAGAARLNEKMRSLRILVERNGGHDLLAETPPPPAAVALPGAIALPDAGAGDSAPAPGRTSFVDPNALPGFGLAMPSPGADTDAAGAAATAADEPTEPVASRPEEVPGAAPEAQPELELQVEHSVVRPLFPSQDDACESTGGVVAESAADLDAESGAESASVMARSMEEPLRPDPESRGSVLAELAADEAADSPCGADGDGEEVVAGWNPPPDAWIEGGGSGVPVPSLDEGGDALQRGDDVAAPAADAAMQPAAHLQPAAAPLPDASWVDALRRTPLWIPPESAPPSATPEAWSSGANMEMESVIDSFREQMARALDGDGAARYDLGVAYYEMGLYNEALAEFEAASRCPGLEVRSYEMLAACLLHTGRHAEVVELLLPVLAADGHSPRGRLGLQYSLGLAYEALGDRDQALRCFEEVALVDIDFKDVQARLQRSP